MSNNDTRKPREFWISEHAYDDYTQQVFTEKPEDGDEYVQVIEYSAYEMLKRSIGLMGFHRGNDEWEALRKERDELHARLAQRHIIGKAYEVTRETVNRLAGELEETKEQHAIQMKVRDKVDATEIAEYRTEIFDLQKERDELKAINGFMTLGRDFNLKRVENLEKTNDELILAQEEDLKLIDEVRTALEVLGKERDEYRAALEHFASVHEKAVPSQDLITGEGSIDKLRSILAKYPNGAKKERK